MATDLLWWRGLARIMENKGYIKEGDGKVINQNYTTCFFDNVYAFQ